MTRSLLTCLLIVAGCGDPDCPAGTRYEDPRCVPIDAGSDSGPTDAGGSDATGPAVDGSTMDGGACAQTMCGEDCVDTMTDARHCGGCDTPCDLRCIDGACVDAVVDVAAGHFHSCALKASGSVVCWGSNESGQLGNGTTTDSLVPSAVVGIDDAIQISAAGKWFRTFGGNTCALRSDHTVWCWGRNDEGQLGNGTMGAMTFSNVPVQVTGVADAVMVDVGDTHSCALRSGGAVTCWGGTSPTAAPVAGVTNATQVAAGVDHDCARLESGRIVCWGDNDHGELGNGATDPTTTPVTAAGFEDAAMVTVGIDNTCGLHATGTVECWGRNFFGALGTELPAGDADRLDPAPVDGLSDAVQTSGILAATCARTSADDVWCWGLDIVAAAAGTQTESRHAVRVLGLAGATDLAVGHAHACALLRDGSVACWGSNEYGQLADGTTTGRPMPVQAVGLP